MFSYKIIIKPTKKNDHVRTYINCKKKNQKLKMMKTETWKFEKTLKNII